MGAQIDLFCKFTRKTSKSLKVILADGLGQMNLVGGGPYFAPGTDEVGSGASKG